MAVATDALGVPGYSFADLHEPERLSSLYERFCEEVQAEDPSLWREWDAYRGAPDAPRAPLAIARAGCALLDLEKANREPRIPNPQSEALKRWCAARIQDRAYRGWVIFRFPENVEPFHLVDVDRPEPERPEAMVGPSWRLRR